MVVDVINLSRLFGPDSCPRALKLDTGYDLQCGNKTKLSWELFSVTSEGVIKPPTAYTTWERIDKTGLLNQNQLSLLQMISVPLLLIFVHA